MTEDISALMTRNKNNMLLLRLRNDKTIRGRLHDFDMHMNLVLIGAEDISDAEPKKLGKILLRGDNILSVSLPEERQ